MNSKKQNLVNNISKTAFWDVDFDVIDFEKNSLFVMTKVFNYGTFDDIIAAIRYYGMDRIRNEIVEGSYFDKQVLSFLCLILGLKADQFIGYQNRQKNNLVWNY